MYFLFHIELNKKLLFVVFHPNILHLLKIAGIVHHMFNWTWLSKVCFHFFYPWIWLRFVKCAQQFAWKCQDFHRHHRKKFTRRVEFCFVIGTPLFLSFVFVCILYLVSFSLFLFVWSRSRIVQRLPLIARSGKNAFNKCYIVGFVLQYIRHPNVHIERIKWTVRIAYIRNYIRYTLGSRHYFSQISRLSHSWKCRNSSFFPSFRYLWSQHNRLMHSEPITEWKELSIFSYSRSVSLIG